MSEKEWYTLLLENNITKELVGGREEYIKCRVERASRDTDWVNSWRLARLPGLGPDNISFLFRLLHQLLPTKERIARTKPNANPECRAHGCQAGVVEDLSHALIYCHANDGVGLKLLDGLRDAQHDLQADAALRLEFQVGIELELPVVWLSSCILRIIWNMRQTNTRIRHYLIRSQLEAEINLLRETRFYTSVPRIVELAATILN